MPNIQFWQNIRHFEGAEYSVLADSIILGFGRSLLPSFFQQFISDRQRVNSGTGHRRTMRLRLGLPPFVHLRLKCSEPVDIGETTGRLGYFDIWPVTAEQEQGFRIQKLDGRINGWLLTLYNLWLVPLGVDADLFLESPK